MDYFEFLLQMQQLNQQSMYLLIPLAIIVLGIFTVWVIHENGSTAYLKITGTKEEVAYLLKKLTEGVRT
jgi:hypothetical protein